MYEIFLGFMLTEQVDLKSFKELEFSPLHARFKCNSLIRWGLKFAFFVSELFCVFVLFKCDFVYPKFDF